MVLPMPSTNCDRNINISGIIENNSSQSSASVFARHSLLESLILYDVTLSYIYVMGKMAQEYYCQGRSGFLYVSKIPTINSVTFAFCETYSLVN